MRPGHRFTGAGITTALGHAIGARHDVENGIVNAIILPHALRFNGEAIRRPPKVATALGLAPRGTPCRERDRRLDSIFSALGIPRRLRDVGVPREALPGIAALGMADRFLRGNRARCARGRN